MTRLGSLLAGSALAVLAAGAGVPALGQAPPGARACVLLPDTALPRWERQDRRQLAAAFTAAGVAHTIVNAGGSGRRQRAQARACLADGAKVLLLAHVDEASGRSIGRLAAAAGVPVVDYARLTRGGGARILVAADHVHAGRLLAEGVLGALPARPRRRPVVVRLSGPPDAAAPLVARGADAVLASAARRGRIALGRPATAASWRPDALAALARRLVSGPGRADAVVATDDRLAGAVVRVLEQARRGPVPLSGRSASLAGVRNVLAGRQTGTVYDSPKLLASAAARVAVDLLAGRRVRTNGRTSDGSRNVPSVLVRPVWITRGNYAVLFAEGAYTRSEVCGPGTGPCP